MTDTMRLGLPLMDAAQAQKHVTHNEALTLLDALTHLSVRTRAGAPAVPLVEGARYLVAKNPTGLFAGRSDQIAVVQDGAWTFLSPKTGWRVFVEDEVALIVYDGADWRVIASGKSAPDQFARLGVGTASEEANPLSVKLNNALFASLNMAEGGSGDLRFKMNKQGAANTLSQLYQSNWIGRAETGLMGDDAFRIKVSGDGQYWVTALMVDTVTGNAGLGISPSSARLDVGGAIAVNGKVAVNGPAFSAWASSAQITPAGAFTKVGFKTKEFDTANCFDSITLSRFKPLVPGYYQVSANVRQTDPTAGEWVALLYKNGAVCKSGSSLSVAAGGNYQSHVSALVYLNGVTDYLEVYVYSTMTSWISSSQSGTYFQGVMVRGA